MIDTLEPVSERVNLLVLLKIGDSVPFLTYSTLFT